MEVLTAICVISFIGIFLILARIMRNMAKLKKQNDMIYQNALHKNRDLITEELVKRARKRPNEAVDFARNLQMQYKFEDISTGSMIRIIDLPMSARLFRCLNAMEIEYLSQATQYTKKEMLGYRNFGKKSLEELESLMNKHNLKFKE